MDRLQHEAYQLAKRLWLLYLDAAADGGIDDSEGQGIRIERLYQLWNRALFRYWRRSMARDWLNLGMNQRP